MQEKDANPVDRRTPAFGQQADTKTLAFWPDAVQLSRCRRNGYPPKKPKKTALPISEEAPFLSQLHHITARFEKASSD
ncbi:hypothetical protein [Pseudomonas fluorescens]|uniref:hypothetical protein n=1 Tax=Pseudomonas fluorescens TaxID=294 RepID=UPI00130EC54B|nr:hypothetical protein [Pseudomonas fluorescens]